MAADKVGTVPGPRIPNGLSPHTQLVFPESFACSPLRLSAADPSTKTSATTRELTASFLGHRNYFQPHPPPPHQAAGFRHQWNDNSRSSAGDASDDDDDDDEEEVEDKEEEEEGNNLEHAVIDAQVGENNWSKRYSSNSNSQKIKHISALGFKEGNVGQSVNENNNENNSGGELRNARGGEMYYSQYLKYLNSAEGPSTSSGWKEMLVENECGFSGKVGSYYSEFGDCLRAILSDPITGILMDDALILPCGHSFGSGGIQQVLRVKACFTCSQPVSEDSVAPNLSLRLAVQAFRREEAVQADRSVKRRRERYEKGNYDSVFTDHPKARGAQFPFTVTDRVIIKGNKRTPPRFVGREAVITTQCLNGWYVVKTLDSAESVKLQYRSLAKIPDGPSGKR